MSTPGIMVLGVISDGGMRSMLLILLVLAVVFLVAGAVLAIMALRSQRKVGLDGSQLQQLENEAS
jgi:flagellar basal body-associated protein FliL